ncbi:copper resistance protein NlpE N-terminal domain-containing protein [Paludibacteraceae bacterium OttesenSCG-928-F17]|nr:copper resistance protein NlpE N-terminal domain-containing protein [Paludibacteraceae bacterium OttesenSCG-928-F17]
MKATKLILATLFCALVIAPSCKSNKKTNQNQTVTMDNSRTSLDWNGVYTGVLPCADCEGIQTTITLKNDNTYDIITKYLGKDYNENTASGTFTWNNDGNKITLSDTEESPVQYQVGENKLTLLDMAGNRISSDNNYNLIKVSDLLEKYWKLTEIDGTEVSGENTVKEAHMTLRVASNRVNGSGGCNTFNGTYVIQSENNITFSRVASTMMACPNMGVEGKLFKAFEGVRHYSVMNDKLELKDENNKVLARFEAVYM